MEDLIVDETPDTKRIWDKTQDEITVGDSWKMTGVVFGAFALGTVVITAAPVVFDSVREKFRARRAAKLAAQEESDKDETTPES